MTYVQLVLNLPRIRRQRAADAWLGTALAQSLEPVDPSWADALAETPEQAEELDYRINAARQDARSRIRERRERW